MTTNEQVLGTFIEAWEAGRRPVVDEYLTRVPEAQRGELADQLLEWLMTAPTPQYDEATRAQITSEPALQAALAELSNAMVPLPEQVATLRERAGLAIADVAQRVTAAFGLGGQEERTAVYLEQLEHDEIDPSRLSRRLCDALARILGADPDQLAPAPAWSLGAAGSGQALFRAEETPDAEIAEAFEMLSAAAMVPAPAPMDELDRLFVGGPDG